MADVAIPILAAIAPDVIKLIVGLVHKAAPEAEAKFGVGTGPVKYAEVYALVLDALEKAVAAKTLDGVPHPEIIKTIIEAVVASMKTSGVLGSPALNPVPADTKGVSSNSPPVTISLRAGQSLTVLVT